MDYIELGKSSQVEQEYIKTAYADNLPALPWLASRCNLVDMMTGKPIAYILHVTVSCSNYIVVAGTRRSRGGDLKAGMQSSLITLAAIAMD